MSEDIASIGFKVDTSDIERGNVALDALASKGEAVDKSVSQVEAAASKTSKSLDNLGRSVHGVNMGGLGGAAQTAATGMGAAGKAAESGATGVKRMADVLGGFSRDTSKAADALGLYASSTKNAIDHQRELERILDRANPASAAARQLSEEVQTLNRALREGAIGNDTYRASMRNAFDEAEKAAGGVSKVGTAASMVTGLLTKLAGAAAVAFSFGKFISETIAAEQAQAQLQAVLKSTGESAGWTSDQLNAMAQGLASKSIFSVDQIKAAETRLLSYTGIVGQQFPRAMQAVIDMSSRMGMDVTSAAEQIGRALDIPSQGLTALTRQGFRFTEEQKEMVKQLEETGRVAEAQAIVLSAVESSYGGAAEAARGTFGGALKELQKSINDLMTGDSSVPALTAVVNGLTSAVKTAGAIIGEMKVSTDAVAGSISAAALVGNGFSILLETVAVLAVNVAYVLSGVGREIGGIAAQGAALMRFDFTAAAAIRREMVSDAEAARKAVDQTTQNILNARAKLAEKPAINIGAPNAETMAKGAAEAQEKALAAATNARTKAINDLLGVNQKYQEKLTELQGLEKSGALTHEEYTQAVSKLATVTYNATDAGKAAAEASKAGAKARDEAAKATEREAQSYTRFVNSIREKIAAQELELAGGDKLSQSQKVRLQLEKMIADGRLASSRASSEELKTDLDRLKANELEIAGRKAAIDAVNSQRAAYIALSNEAATQNKSIESGNTSLREQIATMGLTNQQIRARTIELNRATIAEKEQQLARLQSGFTNTREQAALEESIRALKERNELLSDQGAKEAQIAAQQEMLDMWQSVERTAHDVFVNIFEDGAGTFKRLGQTLKSALLDMLYQLTVKRWIINIGASFGATGGIFAAGNAVAGQGGSALGLLGNASSIAGNWGAISGWAGGGMSTANAAGSIFANATGTGIDGLLATNGAYGTAAGGGFMSGLATAAPWIAGGLLVANALGLFRTTERKGGGLVGTLGQAGGVHDVDLMRKGGTLFSGPDWFTEDLGVSKLDKIIQTQFDASKAAIKGFAETLGLSTEKIDGFTTALGTQTMGDHGQLGIRLDKDGKPLSDQEVQAAIAEAIKAGSNELAQLLIGTWTETTRTVQRQVVENMGATLSDYGGGGGYASRTVTEQVTDRTYKPSEFAREGEQAIDTLTRLATSLGTVNGIFDTLGLTLYETSMKGGDLASQLADAAGGLDKLQAASANYYQNFYSAAEQHDIALRQLGKQFEALGVVMPATRDEFRHLVESLDLITEGGRTTFAALMNLSGSFAAVVPAVEEISSSTSEMGRAMGDAARATEDLAAMARKAEDEARRASERAAQDAAQAIVKAAQDAASAASEAARKASEAHSKASAMTDRVFAELRKQFDKALQAARTMVDTAQAIAQMTGERSRALYGEIPESRQYGAAAGNAFIDDALRTMLQGGAMPKTDELSRAIDSAVAGLDVNNYASVAQFQADKAILAAKLGAMEKVAGKQLTEGEQQVELLQQQLEHWDEQLSVLRDTQVSVTSIDDGVRQLSGLMAAESAAAGAAREAQDRYAQASLALQQAQQAQQGAAQQPGSIAGAYNSAVANIRAASWYGNGDWGEARGLKLSELSTAIGVDAGDLARLLVQQGLSLHGDLITTRDAYGDHDAEAAAIRAAKWYGSGNWDDARGSSLIGLAKSMGVDPVDLERRLIAEGMQVSADGIVLSKRYAQGGLHSGGWRLVGEQGPEVEFTGPARYWSFDQSRSMLSGGGGGNEELIAENRALRAKVDQLIARLDRVAAATETSARLMDRVTANGNAMRTEAA